MAKLLKLRRGTTTQHSSFTGAEGEVTVDTDKDVPVVHDGSTAGGHPVAAEDMSNVSAADIKGRLSTTITNAEVNASAAIAGTKISPDFGSQNIATTGTLGLSGDITITNDIPRVNFVDSGDNPDWEIGNINGAFRFRDTTNSATWMQINTDGHVDINGNLDVGAGVDVTGNITVSGTVDGVDIAARDTLFGGVTANAGIIKNTVSLADGVTASTQSAGDNSTKVATTAYTDTAITNLVDSSPGALNTLNELAAAINDDANFSTTVTNNIATKMPLAGGEFTGNVTCENITPDADSSRNLGTNSVRFANVYADTFVGSGASLTGIEAFVTGMILLWSGASNAIPSGFVICDGNNSTPDLRNRFVIGAGDTYAVDATGGSTTINSNVTHSHSTPNHTHGLNGHTHSTPDHSHAVNNHTHSISGSVSGNTNNTGSHNHSFTTSSGCSSNGPSYFGRWNFQGCTQSTSMNSAGNHSHSFSGSFSGNSGNSNPNTTSSGASTTGGSNGNSTSAGASNTGNSGSGSTVSVLNPYYALCYIMKT